MQHQHQPGSNPQMPVSGYGQPQQQQQQMPQSGQMPISQPGYNMGGGPPMSNPIPYPGHMMGPGQQGMHGQGMGFGPTGAGKQFKISGQILLLAIVGIICLAIFITGIVLFATTKF